MLKAFRINHNTKYINRRMLKHFINYNPETLFKIRENYWSHFLKFVKAYQVAAVCDAIESYSGATSKKAVLLYNSMPYYSFDILK